jgi:hypothetical protein
VTTGALFTLSRMTERSLQERFQAFHGIFRKNKCTGSYVEEIAYRALTMDHELGERVAWSSGSHSAIADIRILAPSGDIGLSVKSGKPVKGHPDLIQIPGHRLSRAHGDLNLVNAILRKQVSDVVLCFLHNPLSEEYQIIYIDAPVFVYPTTSTGWHATIGHKNGRIAQYSWTSPHGLVAEIKPDLSWQIWWTIPLALCRIGSAIYYGRDKDNTEGMGR